MSYENPQVPHEVNVARGNPLLEFLRLAAGLAIVIVVIGALLYFCGSWLSRLIPFEWERGWVRDHVLGVSSRAQQHEHAELEAYLQSLSLVGFYQRMDSENALSMVLAHEIAHLRARDPIAGLGGSATMLLALAMIGGDAANLSNAFADVVRRGYSRSAEAAADEAAIAGAADPWSM